MARIHLYDFFIDNAVKKEDETKKRGLKGTKCGYMCKRTTREIEKVTCKRCIAIEKHENTF